MDDRRMRELLGTNCRAAASVEQSTDGQNRTRTWAADRGRCYLLACRAFRVVAAVSLLLAQTRAQPTDTPPDFEQIESAFLAFMQANHLPGASLAIAKNGRLVLARGYGLADVEQRQPVQPESLLRFGSIGKTITSIAIMKLVEDGKLNLDASAFALLPDIRPRSGRLGDARIGRITIRNLLTHSGGWDAAVGGDPIAPLSQQIASAMGVAFPPSPTAIISYMLDRRLDFDPGARFAYSNFGFLVLGRVIEKLYWNQNWAPAPAPCHPCCSAKPWRRVRLGRRVLVRGR
jgi:CubicO group peptidase (beta-lactamase class C family)